MSIIHFYLSLLGGVILCIVCRLIVQAFQLVGHVII